MEKQEDIKELKDKISRLKFANAQIKEVAKVKVGLVVEAQVIIDEANDKLDRANELGKDVANYKLEN